MKKDIDQTSKTAGYPSATRNNGPFYWPDDFTPARWFDDFFGSNLSPFSNEDSRAMSMAIDIDENDSEYKICADLPGVKEEDISIDCSGNLLTISAERKTQSDGTKKGRRERFYGVYQRTFSLPQGVDSENIGAVFNDGVLTINVPKTEPVKRRKISITNRDKKNDVGAH